MFIFHVEFFSSHLLSFPFFAGMLELIKCNSDESQLWTTITQGINSEEASDEFTLEACFEYDE